MTKALWNEFLFVSLNVSVFTQLSPGELQSISATLPAASTRSTTDMNAASSIFIPNNDKPLCLCSSYLRKCFLLVRFMRPPPQLSSGGPATSELVIGIPRLIRLIVSLNSRIIIALLLRLAFSSPWFPLPDCSKTARRLGSHSGAVSVFFPFLSFFLFFFLTKSWLPMWGMRAKLARKWSCHSETEEVRCSVGRRS